MFESEATGLTSLKTDVKTAMKRNEELRSDICSLREALTELDGIKRRHAQAQERNTGLTQLNVSLTEQVHTLTIEKSELASELRILKGYGEGSTRLTELEVRRQLSLTEAQLAVAEQQSMIRHQDAKAAQEIFETRKRAHRQELASRDDIIRSLRRKVRNLHPSPDEVEELLARAEKHEKDARQSKQNTQSLNKKYKVLKEKYQILNERLQETHDDIQQFHEGQLSCQTQRQAPAEMGDHEARLCEIEAALAAERHRSIDLRHRLERADGELTQNRYFMRMLQNNERVLRRVDTENRDLIDEVHGLVGRLERHRVPDHVPQRFPLKTISSTKKKCTQRPRYG